MAEYLFDALNAINENPRYTRKMRNMEIWYSGVSILHKIGGVIDKVKYTLIFNKFFLSYSEDNLRIP